MRLRQLAVILIFTLSACAPAATPEPPTLPTALLAASEPSAAPTATAAPPTATLPPTALEGGSTMAPPLATETPTLIPTPYPTIDRPEAKYWAEWPLVPVVGTRAREIYRLGQQNGLNPHAFSTVGDCQSEPSVFMGTYDTDSYVLGQGYEYLEETIAQFKGSFGRDAVTVKDGLSVASALSPAWADPARCEPNETPLACEIRTHKPVILFINLGTNWRGGDDVSHEKYLRQIVDYAISQGVIPVISSKGDNQEGDHRINRSLARVAYDYDLPCWNFWLSIRHLPAGGLDDSRPGGYLIPEAWGPRSFTGLQALDAVWRAVSAP